MRVRYIHLGNLEKSREVDIKRLAGDNYEFPKGLIFSNENKYVLAIDPGTKMVGMSLGLLNKPTIICSMQIDRSNGLLENTAEFFTQAFRKFLERFVDLNNVVDVQLEEQFMNPKYKDSYRKLTSFSDMVKSLCSSRRITLYTCAPQTWKGVYLEKYPGRSSLNMTRDNKSHIKSWSRKQFPELFGFQVEDAFDSIGILYYYYKTNFRPEGVEHIIQVRKDMPRDYRSKITMIFGKITKDRTFEHVKTMARNIQETSDVERNINMFRVSEDFGLEDNIRSLITNNNGIYLAFYQPYPKAMAEIFRNRSRIGGLSIDMAMYLVGFRTLGKK